MKYWPFCLLAAALSCSSPKPALSPAATAAETPTFSGPPKITQFYATAPKLARGEREMLCYGVENARKVWMAPPVHEFPVSLARCIPVNPTETTTFTLTAEGPGGPAVTQDVTVTLGAPKARIIEVRVSTLQLKRGDPLSICYRVANAKAVNIVPIGFHGDSKANACTIDHPSRVTTYTVTAVGADGDTDEEKVTVNVR